MTVTVDFKHGSRLESCVTSRVGLTVSSETAVNLATHLFNSQGNRNSVISGFSFKLSHSLLGVEVCGEVGRVGVSVEIGREKNLGGMVLTLI